MSSRSENSVKLPNPHLTSEKDYLYHFGLKTDSEEFTRRFNDIKVEDSALTML